MISANGVEYKNVPEQVQYLTEQVADIWTAIAGINPPDLTLYALKTYVDAADTALSTRITAVENSIGTLLTKTEAANTYAKIADIGTYINLSDYVKTTDMYTYVQAEIQNFDLDSNTDFTALKSRVSTLESSVSSMTSDIADANATAAKAQTVANNAVTTANSASTVATNAYNTATSAASDVADLDTTKQDTLVSGENIKTINGTSLLGSGDYAFDSAFDETSTNAVQNKVISKEVKELNYELAVLREAVFEVVLSEIDYTSVFTDSFTIPDTLTDTDGTHRVVFSETQLKKVAGNSVVANQLDRHLTFSNNDSQYYSCSVDTATGLYTLEIIKEGMPTNGSTFVSYPNAVFNGNVLANDKILIYFDVVENTLNGADTYNGQFWIFSNDGYSISYQPLTEGQHANIISINANQGSASIDNIFRPLGNRTIPQQVVGTKIRFYLRVCNLTRLFGAGNEPTSVDDVRIQWLIKYLENNPDYDTGTIKSSIINGLQSLDSNDEVIGTIAIPPTEIKSAGTAQDYIEVVEGDIVEGEQLYNLVKTTNAGSATPTQTTIATNLHFSEISMLIAEGGKIKPLYDNVPVDTTLTLVVKKAISE